MYINNTTCYLCHDSDKIALIRPCKIQNCEAVAHINCVKDNLEVHQLKCPLCQNNIVLPYCKKFSMKKFYSELYEILIIIISLIILPLCFGNEYNGDVKKLLFDALKLNLIGGIALIVSLMLYYTVMKMETISFEEYMSDISKTKLNIAWRPFILLMNTGIYFMIGIVYKVGYSGLWYSDRLIPLPTIACGIIVMLCLGTVHIICHYLYMTFTELCYELEIDYKKIYESQ